MLSSENFRATKTDLILSKQKKQLPNGGHVVGNTHAHQWCTVIFCFEFADFIDFEAKYTVMYAVLPQHGIYRRLSMYQSCAIAPAVSYWYYC